MCQDVIDEEITERNSTSRAASSRLRRMQRVCEGCCGSQNPATGITGHVDLVSDLPQRDAPRFSSGLVECSGLTWITATADGRAHVNTAANASIGCVPSDDHLTVLPPRCGMVTCGIVGCVAQPCLARDRVLHSRSPETISRVLRHRQHRISHL